MEESIFVEEIVKSLLLRDSMEKNPFQSIYNEYNELIAKLDAADNFNDKLVEELAEKNKDIMKYQIQLDMGAANTNKQAFQSNQKYYEQQQELTNLHRMKSSNISQILELKAKNELLIEDKKCQEMLSYRKEEEISQLKNEIFILNQKIKTIKRSNEELLDEQTSTVLELQKSQEKCIDLTRLNNDIVCQLKKYKSSTIDMYNKEIELNEHNVCEKIRFQIAEATSDTVDITKPDISKFSVTNTIPNKVRYFKSCHSDGINYLTFLKDGSFLATASNDKKTRVWKVTEDDITLNNNLIGCNATVTCVDFDSNTNQILAASNDCASYIWNVSNSRLHITLTGHSGKISASKFLNSNVVLSASHDRSIKIWDIKKVSCSHTYFTQSLGHDLIISKNGLHDAVSCHFDRTIRFWDIRIKETARNVYIRDRVMSLDMTNDGKYLLCVTRENGIKIVDMRQKTVINKILDEGYDREICRASFSPDGSYIVAGSTNGRMFFWNTNDVSLNKIVIDKRLESESKNFDELYSQLAHITCAIWNPEANFVVSGDTHGVITYYD